MRPCTQSSNTLCFLGKKLHHEQSLNDPLRKLRFQEQMRVEQGLLVVGRAALPLAGVVQASRTHGAAD